MAGTDTIRGVTFQHCQAILIALEVATNPHLHALRVEGIDDVVDIEVFAADLSGALALTRAVQVKTRSSPHTWSRSALISVLRRWLATDGAATARFEFLTNGALGPSADHITSALELAASGSVVDAGTLLGLSPADSLTHALPRVAIRVAPDTAETLLHEAERDVLSMLSAGRVQADAELEARNAVNRLLASISVRAGSNDPADRLMTADQIRDVIQVSAAVPPLDRWGSVRDEYIDCLQTAAVQPVVIPTLHRRDFETGREEIATVDDFLSADAPRLVAGNTGSGKSTLADLIRTQGASAGVPVILCHLEAYSSSRLDALVAASLSSVVGRPLPRSVGRQCLDDPGTLVIIDGASETPHSIRVEAAIETRAHCAADDGAKLALFGRDAATASLLLPSHAHIRPWYVSSFGAESQKLLAVNLLASREHRSRTPAIEEHSEVSDLDDHRARGLVAQVERALGDASGNPLLFELAGRLILSGLAFTDRASLYRASIDRLAERGMAADISIASAVVGIVFANLLNEGRRYATRFEWDRLMLDATRILTTAGFAIDMAAVTEAVDRSGILSAVTAGIGNTVVRGAVHDSFADYLAGRAHADGLVDLPAELAPSDEQRVVFAALVRSPSEQTLLSIAQQIPLTLVKVASTDARRLSPSFPEEVARLLRRVLPAGTPTGVLLWHRGEATLLQATAHETGWDNVGDGETHISERPTIVCSPDESPGSAAVRLWQLFLRSNLPVSTPAPRPPLRSAEEIATQIQMHVTEVREQTMRGLELIPPTARAAVEAQIGDLGLTATVAPHPQDNFGGPDWHVEYRQSEAIDVIVAEAVGGRRLGSTSARALLDTAPTRAATKRISEAINALTHRNWL